MSRARRTTGSLQTLKFSLPAEDFAITVAVITPCFRPNMDWLRQGNASVQAQTHPCRQFFVVDGSPGLDFTDFAGTQIRLPRNYGDYGNTPRALGSLYAVTHGFDAIAFLDDDNWMEPDHVASVLEAIERDGADFGASGRMLHHLDGRPLMECPYVNGVGSVDTNCLVVTKSAYDALIGWISAPPESAARGDQYFQSVALQKKKRFVFTGRPTIAYRTRHKNHYELAGVPAPPGAVRRDNESGDAYDRV